MLLLHNEGVYEVEEAADPALTSSCGTRVFNVSVTLEFKDDCIQSQSPVYLHCSF